MLEAKPFFVKLPNRGAVRVAGPDRVAFLQALISNDVRLLEKQPAVYSCFLTPQGKFLHDFFLTADGESLVLECEGGARAENLAKRLKPFKLRSKIEMSVEPERDVFVIVYSHPNPLPEGEGVYADPRHAALGVRTHVAPTGIEEQPFTAWDQLRLQLGVPDGSRDMAVDKDTLLECRMDHWHGLSFEKGCYVGQEIAARMHLRGLVKKRLLPVKIVGAAPAPFTGIYINSQLVGQMRSSREGVGLALLKEDSLYNVN